jgi:hypothetical protein
MGLVRQRPRLTYPDRRVRSGVLDVDDTYFSLLSNVLVSN